MKTSELINKLEAIKGVRVVNTEYIRITDNQRGYLGTVGTAGNWLNIEYSCTPEIAKILFEYYLTPLEERKNEQKYTLKSPLKLWQGNKVYLNMNDNNDGYFSEDFKGQFTQKEIDILPKSWQDFLIKEEVK